MSTMHQLAAAAAIVVMILAPRSDAACIDADGPWVRVETTGEFNIWGNFQAKFYYNCLSQFSWTYSGDGMTRIESISPRESPFDSGTLGASCLTGPGVITATWSDKNGVSHSSSASVGLLDHTPQVELKEVPSPPPYWSTKVHYKVTVPYTSGKMWAALYNVQGHTIDTKASGEGLPASETIGDWEFSGSGSLKVTVESCNGRFRSVRTLPIGARNCKDCTNNCDRNCVAHPLRTSNGNVRITETDPIPSPAFLPFQRIYDSRLNAIGMFGRGWTSFFDSRLMVIAEGSDPAAYVAVSTHTGAEYLFERSGGLYRQVSPPPGPNSPTISQTSATDWSFDDNDTDLRLIFSSGKVTRYQDRPSGRYLQITYDSAGHPSLVSDSFARWTWYITFSTTQQRITQIYLDTTPSLTWKYSYDGAGNVVQVLAPGDQLWRTYSMAAVTSGLYVLTAVRDARDKIVEQHAYDGFRGSTSFGPGGDVTAVQYDQPGRTPEERAAVFTWASGKIETRYLRPIDGEMRTVEIAGGCTTCTSRGDGVFVYDPLTGSETRAQNARGYITERTYFADGRVHSVRTNLVPSGCNPDPDAGHCRQTPDTLATLALNTTPATLTTTYTYDPVVTRKPASITTTGVLGGGDRVETFTYDASSRQVLTRTVTGSTGIPTRRESRTTTTVLYNGSSDAAAFDPGGSFNAAWLSLPQPKLPRSVDGPRTDVADSVTYVYYPIHTSVTPNTRRGHLAAVRNALGHITRYESYDAFGNATRVVDPNGVPTEMTYDSLGRLLTTTLKGDPSCTGTSYDALCATDVTGSKTYLAAGPLNTETRPAGGVSKYEYDDESRVVALSRGPSATDLRERSETDYDSATGKKSAERLLAWENGAWVVKKSESFTYDSDSDLTAVTHADGKTIGYTYTVDGQIATIRDENHTLANTAYGYDAGGRPTRVEQTLSTAPGGKALTLYTYDVAANLRSVTDPNGNAMTYLYDDFGQMLRQVSPVSGTTTYTYDLAGNLIGTTDANGASTTRSYDAGNRTLSTDTALGSQHEVVAYGYDNWAGLGRLASIADPSGYTAYYYTRAGQLRAEQRNLDGTLYTTQRYRYERDGNADQITYPSGNIVTYTFDYAGRPYSAIAGSTGLVWSAAYMPFGPLKAVQYGNLTNQYFVSDNRYRLSANALMQGSTMLATYTYGYDDAGNITSITDAVDATRHRQFTYDDLNRLTSANTGTSLWGTATYTYDAMGNLQTATRGTATTSFGYLGTTPKLNSVTEPAGTVGVTYDPAGNETASGSTYTISPRNLVALVTTAPSYYTYTYDASAVRVRTTATPRLIADISFKNYSFYTPDKHLLSRLDFTTSFNVTSLTGRTEYIWFAGRPIAHFTNGDLSTRRFTATDHLGTPIIQTNPAGTIVWRAEYDPYGTIYQMRTGTESEQILRLPGQEMATDREYYNIHRWYRPGWGRYTQADPLDSQIAGVLNNYRYALSNPLRWIDPTGLESQHASDNINCLSNPIDCARVYKCIKEATDASEKKFGYAKDGTPQNAYKHCYWNCCMTKIIGPVEAKKFGDAHENYPGNSPCDKDMDLWNNEQGRKVTGSTTCDSHCSNATLQKWRNCQPCGFNPWRNATRPW